MGVEIEIVRIPVVAARARQLAVALKAARSGYLAAPACADLEILTTQANDEVVAIVRWSSASAHEQATRGPHAQAFFSLVGSYAAGTPQLSRYLPFETP